MEKRVLLVCVLLVFVSLQLIAQRRSADELYTREGISITKKRFMVETCIRSIQSKSTADETGARKICECQVELLDGRFTQQQIRIYSKKYKELAFQKLMEEDTALQSAMPACTEKDSSLNLFSLNSYAESFQLNLSKSIRGQARGELKEINLQDFCTCATAVFQQRGFTLKDQVQLNDPNSLLYNELAFKCGDPYSGKKAGGYHWNEKDNLSIGGPKLSDTVPTIQIGNVNKVKLRIGNHTNVWTIDSGASDLLISKEFEEMLLGEGLLKQADFIETGTYTLADDRTISCRRYLVHDINIGSFVLHDVVMAASDSVRQFLLGKSVLNKFSSWTIDNRQGWLVLVK